MTFELSAVGHQHADGRARAPQEGRTCRDALLLLVCRRLPGHARRKAASAVLTRDRRPRARKRLLPEYPQLCGATCAWEPSSASRWGAHALAAPRRGAPRVPRAAKRCVPPTHAARPVRRSEQPRTDAAPLRPRSVLVGFVYPAFQSWKALEGANQLKGETAVAGGAPSQSQSAWLTYWVVFSLFNVVEHLADVLVSWCAAALRSARRRYAVERASLAQRGHFPLVLTPYCGTPGYRSITSQSSRSSSGCRLRRLGCACNPNVARRACVGSAAPKRNAS